MRARLRRAAAALTGWVCPKWPWLRWLLLALVLTVVVLWPLPAWLTRHPSHGLSAAERLKATNDVRATLVQALAGLALLGGLFFTARTLRLTAKSTDLAARSMDLNVKNFDLAREEQLTERYTKAVEQLGSDKLDVRLGGIYALERLMVDSERDHPTIVEVLAAFLREHATAPANPTIAAGPTLLVGSVAQPKPVLPSADHAPLPADTAAAVRVIARRPSDRKERGPLDLHGSYLSGANLSDAKLSYADLSDADLSRVNLSGAKLSYADLSDADLSRADLSDADLSGADLSRADLSGAKLSYADLSGANLSGANLSGADDTDGALPSRVNLSRANLSGANLSGATLFYPDLFRADLSRSDLSGANLLRANLLAANLSGANLSGAKLSYSDLSGAMHLKREQLNSAASTEGSSLPRYLARDIG